MRLIKIFSFFALLVLSSVMAFAAAPTTQATNLVFTNVTPTSLTINWTNGDATNGDAQPDRYIILSEDGTVDGTFTDADNLSTVDGTYANKFPLAGSDFVIAAVDGGGSVNLSGLTANTTYTFMVVEANTVDNTNIVAADILTTAGTRNPLAVTTLVTGQTNPTAVTFTSVTATGVTVNWAAATTPGAGRVLVISTTPITNDPASSVDYTAADLSFANKVLISGDDYVIEDITGAGTSAVITGLTANTKYYFKVYEFNGTLATPNAGINTSNAAPTEYQNTTLVTGQNNPTYLTFSNVTGTTMTVSWTPSTVSGTGRILVYSRDAITNDPANSVDYSAATGSTANRILVATGQNDSVIYAGTGTSASLTALDPNTKYYFRVYEYNGTLGDPSASVFTTTGEGTANTVTTKVAPSVAAKYLSFTNVGSTSMTLNWTNGNGTGRLIVVGTDATFTKPEEKDYSAADFNYANKVATGGTNEYVVGYVSGNTRSATITGLSASTEYYFRIYEVNGDIDNSPLLSINHATSTSNPRNKTTTAGSVTAPTFLTFVSAKGKYATVRWTAGAADDANLSWYFTAYTDATTTTAMSGYDNLDLGSLNTVDADGTIVDYQEEAILDFYTAGTYAWGVKGYNGSEYSTFVTTTASPIVISDPVAPTMSTLTNTSYTTNYTGANSVTLTFSEAVYTGLDGNGGGSGTLTIADFTPTVTTNSGNLITSDVTLTNVTTSDNVTFKIEFTLADYATGAESLKIAVSDNDQIFDLAGNPLSGDANLTISAIASAHYLSSTTSLYYNTFDQGYSATAAAGTLTVTGNTTTITYADDETIAKAITITNAGTADKYKVTGTWTVNPATAATATINKLTFEPASGKTPIIFTPSTAAGANLTVTNSTFTLANNAGISIPGITSAMTGVVNIGTASNGNTFTVSSATNAIQIGTSSSTPVGASFNTGAWTIHSNTFNLNNTGANGIYFVSNNSVAASTSAVLATTNTFTGSGVGLSVANSTGTAANAFTGTFGLTSNTFNNTGLAVKLTENGNSGGTTLLASMEPITLTTNSFDIIGTAGTDANSGFSTGFYYNSADPVGTPNATLANTTLLFPAPVVQSADATLDLADDYYATIQGAVTPAVSTGYTFVAGGTYTEALTSVDCNIYGKNSTVLNGAGSITIGGQTAAITLAGLTFTKTTGNAITIPAAAGAFTVSMVKDTFNLSGSATGLFTTNGVTVSAPITVGGGSTANACSFVNTGSAPSIAFGTSASGTGLTGAVNIAYNTFSGASTSTTGYIARFVTGATISNTTFVIDHNTFSNPGTGALKAIYFSNATATTANASTSATTISSNNFTALASSNQYAVYVNQISDNALPAALTIGSTMDPDISFSSNTFSNTLNGGIYGAAWLGDGVYGTTRADGLNDVNSVVIYPSLSTAVAAGTASVGTYLHIGGGTYAQDLNINDADITNVIGYSTVIDGWVTGVSAWFTPNRVTLNNGNSSLSVTGLTFTYLDLVTSGLDLDNYSSMLVDGSTNSNNTYVRFGGNTYPGFDISKSMKINGNTTDAIAAIATDGANSTMNSSTGQITITAASAATIVIDDMTWSGTSSGVLLSSSGAGTQTLTLQNNNFTTTQASTNAVTLAGSYTLLNIQSNTFSANGTGASNDGGIGLNITGNIVAYTPTTGSATIKGNTFNSDGNSGLSITGSVADTVTIGGTFATATDKNTFTNINGGANLSINPSTASSLWNINGNDMTTAGTGNNISMAGTYTGGIVIGAATATGNDVESVTGNAINLNLTSATTVSIKGNTILSTTGKNLFLAGTYSGAVTVGAAANANAFTNVGGTGVNLTGTYSAGFSIVSNTFSASGTTGDTQEIGIRLGTTAGASLVLPSGQTGNIQTNTFNLDGDDVAYDGSTASALGTGGDIGIIIDTDGGSAATAGTLNINTTNVFNLTNGTNDIDDSRAAIVFWGADQTNTWKTATVNLAGNTFNNDGYFVYATKSGVSTIVNSTFPTITVTATNTDGAAGNEVAEVSGYYMIPNTALGVTGASPDLATSLVTRPTITVNDATTPSTQTQCIDPASAFNIVSSINTTGTPTKQWQISTDAGSTWTNVVAGTGTNAPYYTTPTTAASLAVLAGASTDNVLDGKKYRVIYTGTLDTAISTVVTLSTPSSATYTTNLTNGNIYSCPSTDKTLTVNTTNTTNYDWEVSTDAGSTWNDVPTGTVDYDESSSANTSTLTIKAVNINAKATANYRYRVIVSGACTTPVTSNVAILNANPTPTLTSGNTGTHDDAVCESPLANRTVIAVINNGGNIVSYKWQRNPGGSGTYADITSGHTNQTATGLTGVTSATLTINDVTYASNGDTYRILVTDNCGTVTTLTIPTAVSVGDAPTPGVVGNTSGANIGLIDDVCLNGTTTVVIPATTPSGDGTWLKWQYSKDRKNVANDGLATWLDASAITADGITSVTSTAGSLTLVGVTTTQHQNYFRVVYTKSGGCTDVASTSKIMNVYATPVASTVASPAGICSGSNVTFTANTGSAVGTHQRWEYSANGGTTWANVTGLPGTIGTVGTNNSTTLTINSVLAAGNGVTFRTIYNTGGTCEVATVTPATLTVTALPTASLAASSTVCASASSNTITATTTNASSYSWTRNGTPITNGANYSGATTAALTVLNSSLFAGTFEITATNGTCTAVANQVVTSSPVAVASVVTNSVSSCELNNIVINATTTSAVGTFDGWEYSTDGTTWNDLAVVGSFASSMTETAASLTFVSSNYALNGVKFRTRYTSSPCSNAYSNSCTVTIDRAFAGEFVGGTSATACANATTTTFTIGASTNPTVTWERSTDGGTTWTGSMTEITTTNTTLTITTSNMNAYNGNKFRAKASVSICGDDYNNPLTLTVSPAPVASTVASTSVCPTNDVTLTANTGSAVGTFVRWEYSSDAGSTWNTVPSAVNNLVVSSSSVGVVTTNTSTTLTINSVSSGANGVKFRTVYSNGTCTNATTTTPATLTVSSPVASNVANQTVCTNGNIVMTTSGSTVGSFVNWEYSTNGGTSWNTVSGTLSFATSYTAVAASLTLNTVTAGGNGVKFRTVYTSGSCSGNSATVGTLTVSDPVASTVTSPAAVCVNDNVTINTNTASAVGTFSNWEYSTNGGSSWNTVTGTLSFATSYTATSASLTLNTVTSAANGVKFRTLYTSGSCSATSATAATVTVNALPINKSLVTTSGTMAEGGSGTVTVASSENGVTYTVKNGSTTVGTGTGTGSNLGITVSGASLLASGSPYTLTVVATNSSSCGTTLSNTFAMTVTGGSSTPTKWVISTIASQVTGTSFNVTVQAKDASDALANVDQNTNLVFTINTGTGTLTGSATMLNGTNSITANLTYTKTNGETGVKISVDNSGGMDLTAATSNAFVVRAAAPTTQATAITFSAIGQTQMTIGWTNGNGTGRTVLAAAGSSITSDPSDGTSYTASSTFGAGTQVGTGNYVVYSGSSNSVTVTGLTKNTKYAFKVYAYNNNGTDAATTSYLTSDATGNPKTRFTNPKLAETGNGETFNNSVSSAYPNPVKDEVSFELVIGENTNVTADVYSETGSFIGNFVNADLTAGDQKVSFKLPEHLTSGTYSVIFRMGNEVHVERIAVVK